MNRRALLEFPKGQLLMPGSRSDYAYLSPTDPACEAMTDFRNGPMITTPASTSIELALQQMKLSGARFAFVVDERGALVGSVTSYDIQGEKPIRYMQSLDRSHTTGAWRDVTVENIMEAAADWQVIAHSAVMRLTIGDVASLMADAGLRYLVVVDRLKDTEAMQVRGLFSGARIQMLLGTASPGVAPAHTFAQIEREIV
ncbi:MAG TPA: CBS domain-containing protein [Burkholderiaceae bacterium]|jgi:CBS-domain-containing membrane protein|nr:CBS domain-containing protein [Burkholderiaceae bacterium]